MGIFRKKHGSDHSEDTDRSALFGSKSEAKPSPPSSNPYAQPPSQNPYAQAPPDPYTAAKQKAHGDPEPYSKLSDLGLERQVKSNEYQDGRDPTGYRSTKYGNQSGYGSNRYGNAELNQNPAGNSAYGRPGGYGGLGAGPDQDDENRSALFGGRMQQKSQTDPNANVAPPSSDASAQFGGYSSQQGDYTAVGGYGNYNPGPKYDDRQLTAEEEEEEEVNATKQRIKLTKQEDVASTRNALRIAQQAEEVGRDTLARMGQQGEHLHNTEKNLDLAENQNKTAEEKARELKTLNRSMWAIHVDNPFNSKSREEERNRKVVEKHMEERDAREATRREAYLSEQRLQKNFNNLSVNDPERKKRNLAERSKYQFEADSDDDAMEDEIDSNLDALEGVTGRLNALARATGEEADIQNRHLERIAEKGDKVDLGIVSNRGRLDRIR